MADDAILAEILEALRRIEAKVDAIGSKKAKPMTAAERGREMVNAFKPKP